MNAIQCKLARVAMGWGIRELAAAAGVSIQTVSRLERGEELRTRTLDRMRQVFEAAGIEFICDGNGFGIMIRKPHLLQSAGD
ncbi:helix-turn-helix transcriptional regulator (plasmid) [Ensifer adhaerens]|uniref:helix-turn-helix domain-containing protein n=1 Tax=Ensifer adhaerens TaxID=106592 RepID=UPI001CBFE5CE|nr:helix-turn-helix transcriptional regulator [Ensifer adhaerens]MBZ7927120.1 helix-turn-helix transcriptional regulator [Ensifer adhaerens]UAX98163.1 helix-turn-helix transcriptional regulator [Ensifer adhaerens]UAY05545.1 helix-turn-helix transcriptional regulator [Ensifer adhaerens]UAY12923.1 helix-turn-helix transcriptional regulator [Ensifer adhaerens]